MCEEFGCTIAVFFIYHRFDFFITVILSLCNHFSFPVEREKRSRESSNTVPIEKVKEILYQVDEIVRNGENIEKALDLVDNSILGEYLHVNEETCSMARGIWKKMQHRRLKRG